MSKPNDVTTKEHLSRNPDSPVAYLGLHAGDPIQVIHADVSARSRRVVPSRNAAAAHRRAWARSQRLPFLDAERWGSATRPTHTTRPLGECLRTRGGPSGWDQAPAGLTCATPMQPPQTDRLLGVPRPFR